MQMKKLIYFGGFFRAQITCLILVSKRANKVADIETAKKIIFTPIFTDYQIVNGVTLLPIANDMKTSYLDAKNGKKVLPFSK